MVDSRQFQRNLQSNLLRELRAFGAVPQTTSTALAAGVAVGVGGTSTESDAKVSDAVQSKDAGGDQMFLVIAAVVVALLILVLYCYCGQAKSESGRKDVSEKATFIELNTTSTGDFPELKGELMENRDDGRLDKFLATLESTGFFKDKRDGSQLTGDAYNARLKQATTLYRKKTDKSDAKENESDTSDSVLMAGVHKYSTRSRNDTPFADDTSSDNEDPGESARDAEVAD